MLYVSERLRLGERHAEARPIEQSVREFRSDFTAKELRAFAKHLHPILVGGPHYGPGTFYEFKDDGTPDRELSEVFHRHLRFAHTFTRRAKRPWSRWTIRLVD